MILVEKEINNRKNRPLLYILPENNI